MINLFDLYNRFCAENNVYQGGWFRPERDFERAANSICLKIWDKWTSQAEKSQEIIDELIPFLKSVNVIVQQTSSNYGLIPYPKVPNIEYARYSSARILLHNNECVEDTSKDICNEKGVCTHEGKKETETQKQKRIELYKDGITEQSIYKVDNSRWAALLNHRSKKPDFENPAMTQYDEGFKVAPRQVSVVVLDYYIKPTYAKFIYSIAPGNPQTGAGDYIIFNEALSGKLQWNETMIPYFLSELGLVYSKYTRDANLFQMTQATKA